jgi:hypothetical protein
MTSQDRLAAIAKRYGWKVWPDSKYVTYQSGTHRIKVTFDRTGRIVHTYALHTGSGSRVTIRGGVQAVIVYMKFYGVEQ